MRLLLPVLLALVACALAPAGAPASEGHASGPGAVFTHGPDRGRTTGLAVPPRPLPARAARAAALPGAWCGAATPNDGARHKADSANRAFHVVYAIPADAPSRFELLATQLQDQTLAASSALVAAYGRALRFDMGTACGPRQLDMSVVRLATTSAQFERLARTSEGTLDALTRGLAAAGFGVSRLGESARRSRARRKNYLVWFDGPAPAWSCGQATVTLDRRRSSRNLNNAGGKVAAVFQRGGQFCGWDTVLHEILHTLGGVQPRGDEGSWSGHCHDAREDVMCDPRAPARLPAGDARVLVDLNNDDYWDSPTGPPLAGWAVNLSRFICPDSTCQAAGVARRASRARAVARGSRRR